MLCVPVGASRGLRWSLLSLAGIIAFLAITTDPADARKRKRYAKKKHHHVHVAAAKPRHVAAYSPRYAAIVVDAKTGNVLHQASPDGLRHPASLTKIMTLYQLFEQLEAGRIKFHTQMPVSDEAASQAPTKLGLKPGQTIAVEDAIKGLVTKSANDAAVVIAEALAGNENAFAKAMTRKAQALGMHRTVYRNASGLPDDDQVTTARDQAALGIAIQERFPHYYRYFSTASFVYRGHAMRNHNRLLGRVEGVDGIKTGYTRASGFNLTTSVRRNGRHVVAVVLGGRSGGERDARMRSLIEGHIVMASTTQRPATRLAEAVPERQIAAPSERAKLPAPAKRSGPLTLRAPNAPPAPPSLASVPPNPPSDTTAAISPPNLGSNDPIKPIPVRTVVVKLVPPKSAPATKPVQIAMVAPPAAPPRATAPARQATVAPVETDAVEPRRSAPPSILGTLPTVVASAGNILIPSANASERPRHVERKGWIIQVGAFEDETEAKQRLSAAQTKAATVLNRADAYTERTKKGDKTYYRARFAGFDRDRAEAACKQLKRNDIVCMALKI
jgi:D-alanyl-D-alanine carboxypeptidase